MTTHTAPLVLGFTPAERKFIRAYFAGAERTAPRHLLGAVLTTGCPVVRDAQQAMARIPAGTVDVLAWAYHAGRSSTHYTPPAPPTASAAPTTPRPPAPMPTLADFQAFMASLTVTATFQAA